MERRWRDSSPLPWLRFVGKRVEVTAGKDEVHRGWLLTVDPVSASVVLVDLKEDGETVRVVMGHAVGRVEVLQEADLEAADRLSSVFASRSGPGLDDDGLRVRRTRVHLWLQQNRVPVEEDGEELRVARVLTVTAPYGPEDCWSSNQIILNRIQNLIRVQPHEGLVLEQL